MKLLVTGASGLLGISLALEAMREYEVIGVDRGKLKSAPFQVIKADLLHRNAIDTIFSQVQPDWLINCAALANLEACEEYPDRARILNADIPGELAQACARKGVRFTHISTDAVFDGEKTDPYTEEDQPNPLGVYAKTKLAGERAVQEADAKAIVARVNFYGWSLSGQRSLGEFFVNNLSAGKYVNGFTDVTFCPTLVNHTIRTLLAMLEKDLCGLYHVVGGQSMSKYQFGVEIARRFGLRESLIQPKSVLSSSLTARRSHNLWLSAHKLSTDLGGEIPQFSTGLDEFYTQYQQGYPQKIRGYQQELPTES
ncbi:MAG TPA: SDR family oxidoreductase [Anaerolineales bacterium]|nr:SDR family oxidoreductase [Anaerolineales bacterium]